MTMKKISFIFGTRPEAIKLGPLILAVKKHPLLDAHVCVTGQHREMLEQVLEVFGVRPDVDLGLMKHNQTLGGLTARAIAAIDGYLREEKPDMVLIQGDTTTVFCAALCAFYARIPIGHVEAGLRTWNKYSPFPEEVNRVLSTRLTDFHFAPTASARDNLIQEGVASHRVYVTGNTVIDALYLAMETVRHDPNMIFDAIPGLPPHGQELVLVTGHRRENFGEGFRNICRAIAFLAQRFPSVAFIYPVHLNPNVQDPVFSRLGDIRNVHLVKPLGYLPFIALMDRATIILTDSGGVQEEAPSLGKPVLVMRDTTERPEAVHSGAVRLVGTDTGSIIENVARLLTDRDAYNAMAHVVNPYGDGRAAERIVDICLHSLLMEKAA